MNNNHLLAQWAYRNRNKPSLNSPVKTEGLTCENIRITEDKEPETILTRLLSALSHEKKRSLDSSSTDRSTL